MVVLGVVLRFYQEMRADNAAEKLKAMVSNTATLVRDGLEAEVPLKMLVPGDIIRLAAGDMVPADVRVLSAKDLFLNQSTLTGESLPVEKKADIASADIQNPLELHNICFLGSNVESGTATAVVVHTGDQTYFGSLATSIIGQRVLTSFDKGINKFTWLMIRFIAVMVPVVFLINGLTRHNWVEAFLFATAVAVGLTPEMLPMIVTVNLSQGALTMARKKVIVKRLNAICDGRTTRVRQHHQVHQDGGFFQLWQHVQRCGGQCLPAVPAHATYPGADKQSAIRFFPDRHPHRRS